MPKTENLQPPDEPRTQICNECFGLDEDCPRCLGEGEIIIDDEDDERNSN